MRNGGGGGGREKGAVGAARPKKTKQKNTPPFVCRVIRVYSECVRVSLGGRGGGRLGCVKDKQTKKKKFQSAVAADPRRDELGVSVGASGTNTSTQSEAAAAGKSQAGGRTPNTETDGTKKIYI